MLSVSCRDEHGNVIAQGHHIAPTELWPYMATIYEGYFNVDRGNLSSNHEGKILHEGQMVLGQVFIQNTEDVVIGDDPSNLAEFQETRPNFVFN